MISPGAYLCVVLTDNNDLIYPEINTGIKFLKNTLPISYFKLEAGDINKQDSGGIPIPILGNVSEKIPIEVSIAESEDVILNGGYEEDTPFFETLYNQKGEVVGKEAKFGMGLNLPLGDGKLTIDNAEAQEISNYIMNADAEAIHDLAAQGVDSAEALTKPATITPSSVLTFDFGLRCRISYDNKREEWGFDSILAIMYAKANLGDQTTVIEFSVYGIPMIVKFGVGGSVYGIISCGIDKQDTFIPLNDEGEDILKTYNGKGSWAMQLYISAAIRGSFGVGVKSLHVALSLETDIAFDFYSFKAGAGQLNLKLGYSARLLLSTVQGDYINKEFTIYSYNYTDINDRLLMTKAASMACEDVMNTQLSEMKPLSRAYLDDVSVWGGSSVRPMLRSSYLGIEGQILKEGIYPYSENKLINISHNGTEKTMLLFLDDVPSRLDNDRTALFYSVYDGNMWSEPVMIDDDGTADHIFSVAETENELLICWENNKNANLSDVEEAVNNMEIKAVIYDKNTGTLGAPFEVISDDTYSYFEPNAAFIGDGKYLVTYNIYDDVKYENMDDAETLISDHLNRYSILAYRVYNSEEGKFVDLSEEYSMPDGRSDYFVDTSFHLLIDEKPETKTTSEEVILYAPDGETEIETQIQDITTETGFYTQNITVREEVLIDPYIVEYAVWKTKAIKDDRDVAVMAYIIDEDKNLETTYDRPIFIKMFVDRPGENFESKPVLLANNGMQNSSLAFGEIDGTCVLFFISDSVDEEKPENNITKINYVNTINLINNIEKYDGYPYIDKTEGSDGELVRTLSNWDSKVNIEDLKICSVGSNMFISWITNENIDDDIKGVMNLIQVSYLNLDDVSNVTDPEELLGNKLLKSSKVYELQIEQGEKRNVTESDLIYHGDKILAVWNALISDDYTIDNTSTRTLKYAAITPEPRLELSDIEIDGRALPGTNVSVGVSVFNNSLTDSTDNVTLQLYETKNGIDTLLNEAVAVSAYGAEGTLTGADTLELKTSYEVPEDFDDITFKAVLKTDSAPEIIKTKTFDISPKIEINTSPVVETIERDKIKISFEVINHGNSDFAGGYCNILQNGEFITNVYMPAIEIDDTAQIETFVDIADSMFTGEVNDPIYGYTEYIPFTIDTGYVEIPVRYDRKLSAKQVESMDQMGALKVDTKLYSMKEGSVQAINAYTENGLGVDGEIIYLSSNPNVVSVDSDGTIYAKEVGIAEITVMLKPANTDIDMAKSAYVRESNLATVPSKYLKTQIVTVYVTDTSTDEPELPIEPPTEPVAEDDEKIGEEVTEGQTTTFTVDEDKIEDTVKKASKGDTVIIPVLGTDDTTEVVAKVPFENIKQMSQKELTLSVESNGISYDLDTTALDTENISKQLGDTKDVSVGIKIKKAEDVELPELEDSQIVVPPISFEVTATSGEKEIEINKFKTFVSSRVELSREQAEQITTAAIVEPDGTLRQVPTTITADNGKYYAKINSLANATYVLIRNEKEFSDVSGKWYEDYANEMASRMIMNGVGDNQFAGEKEVTRAEFAQIIVNALGLPKDSASTFNDVANNTWYTESVAAAHEYGIVSGVGDNKFAPNQTVTRQEAMVMIYNASKLMSLEDVANDNNWLDKFADFGTESKWATDAVKWNLANKIIVGNANGEIKPLDKLTRAEVTKMVLELLRRANLI